MSISVKSVLGIELVFKYDGGLYSREINITFSLIKEGDRLDEAKAVKRRSPNFYST